MPIFQPINKTTATATTSNATPTTLVSVPLAQNQAVTLILNISGVKTNYGEFIGGQIIGGFYRNTGNVTSAFSLLQSLGNTLALATATVTMVANTATESVDIKVTGIAATSINWKLEITSIYL